MESFRECFDILRLEFSNQLHVSEKPVVRRLFNEAPRSHPFYGRSSCSSAVQALTPSW